MTESVRIIVGIVLGLGAATAASSAYLFGRWFMVRHEGGAYRLMVMAHLAMGVLGLGILSVLPLHAWPSLSNLALPLAWITVFYLVAQVCLFRALRGMEASRAAPLLGTKVLILALLTVVFMGQSLRPMQWLAVVMAVSAIFVLNTAGSRLGIKSVSGILLACLLYSMSDLGIKQLMNVYEAAGNNPVIGGMHAACLAHVACGIIALAFLPWSGLGKRDEWKLAIPYGICWLTSVMCLYGAFAIVGVVLGAMLQSTRGIISVLFGVALAKAGVWHLEQEVSRHVVLRRVLGAALMFTAIAAYLKS